MQKLAEKPTSAAKIMESSQWETKARNTIELLAIDYQAANPADSWATKKTFDKWTPDEAKKFREWCGVSQERIVSLFMAGAFFAQSEACTLEAKKIRTTVKQQGLLKGIFGGGAK